VLGWPLSSLEMLSVARVRDIPEFLMWDWKAVAEEHGEASAPDDWIRHIGQRLAAYLHAHSGRLLSDAPVITAVPSRAPLIARALNDVATSERPSVQLTPSGLKNGPWTQHLMKDQAARLRRTPDDWVVDANAVAGRPVVLVDDVFVTGASLFSYATALKAGGATAVRAIAVVRHIHRTHNDYFDALRIVRRHGEWVWTPGRASVYQGEPS
jgi:pyrimidine operon attenuation protein/uracil phosphoribosyltransferase